MKRRFLAAVMCAVFVLAMLPSTALAVSLDRSQIFVSAPAYYPDNNSVQSLNIQYTYPTGEGISEKCNVVLNKDIGSGGILFRTYGTKYSNFQDSLTGVGGVVTYAEEWETVVAGETVKTTASFGKSALPLTKDAKYYVYMWAKYNSHYYPDELLAILEVRDGKLYYTTDVTAESADVTVTEHQLQYSLSMDSKTITESCNDCEHTKSLSISASSVSYTNTPYTGAQLSDTTDFIAPVGTIKYYSSYAAGQISGGTPLSSAPTGAGYYYATVTLGDKTAAAPFTISLQSHTITVSTDGNGAASASPTSAVMGKPITLYPTPNRGYVFLDWQVLSGGVSISNDQFIMPNNDVSIEATFKPSTYDITYLDQGGGSFSGAHDAGCPTWYTYGTGAALKGASKAECRFGGWYTDSACAGSRVYAVSNTDAGDRVFYAKWTANTYTITASPMQLTFEQKSADYATAPLAQTVTVTNTGNSPVTLTAPTGTSTYTVTPQSGFTDVLMPNGTHTFTVQPVKMATQEANIYTDTFTVKTNHDTSATVNASFTVGTALSVNILGDLDIVAGESTKLTATPSEGIGPYQYSWSGGGINDTTQTVTVSPTVTTEYTVTVTDTGDSSKSASATVIVTAQSNTIVVSPATYYFGIVRTGYAAPPTEQRFTVTYTGNFFVTLREPNMTNASATAYYTISNLSGTVLSAANPTATFTVRPIDSLPAGTYDERITVDTLFSAASTTFDVQLAVSDDVESPTITQDPSDATAALNSPASFTVAATGYPVPTYQWQVDTGSGWTDIPGETDKTYTTENTTPDMQGWLYRCVASNYTTQINTVISRSAALSVTLPITITPRNQFVQGSAPTDLTVMVAEHTGITFTTDFASAAMNGTEILNGTAFDGEDGSIVLRFRQSYLNTLAPGVHTLRVTIASGAYAEGTIIVTVPAPIPATGDNAMPGLWIGILLLAGAGLTASVVLGRGRRHSN